MLTAIITTVTALAGEEGNMRISSSVFSNLSGIPALYTCESKDISPALTWMELPAGAKSLALIVERSGRPGPGRAEDDVGTLGSL